MELMDWGGIALGALGLLGAATAPDHPWRAIDGDTIVNHDTLERVRIMGIDTPEMHGQCAQERQAAIAARDALDRLLASGRQVALERRGHDRFGRTLAQVRVGWDDVVPQLLQAGHGRPYNGGRRQGWC